MIDKKGAKYLVPSLLAVTAVVTGLNGGLSSAKALVPDFSPAYAAETKTGKATKVKKTDDSSSKTTESYKATGDLSKCADGTYYGNGRGYAGNIKVKVVIKDHEMKSIDVVEVEADDAPYVARAKGVISAMLKTQSLSVDTVSGATFSSNGIIKAVEDAINQAQGKGAAQTAGSKKASKTVKHDSSLDGKTYKDGVYTGTAKGYAGNITVKVTIKDGKIADIVITKNEADDEPYLNKAKGVISMIIKTQSTKVDAVSGATYSSNGIIKAVEKALKKAVVKKDTSKTDTDDETEQDTPAAPVVPDVKDEEYTGEGLYVDGVYTGFARAYKGFMYVSVTIAGERITAIDITKTQDDEPYLTSAKSIINRIITKQTTEGIDAVSGATYSSNGILNSVSKALAKALKPITSEEPEEPSDSDEPDTEGNNTDSEADDSQGDGE